MLRCGKPVGETHNDGTCSRESDLSFTFAELGRPFSREQQKMMAGLGGAGKPSGSSTCG
jgi:hypothetical protein